MSDRFPWFPFYVADWRTSDAVRGFTYEQRGLYLELLCIAWGHGVDAPSLPDDDAKLAQISGLSLRRWAKIGRPILGECFALSDGRWTNERLTKVWEIQRAKYEFASIAGKESAKQRALQRNTNGRSTSVARPFQRKSNHTDADTNRTKSSSAPLALGALTDGALAAATTRKPA